MQTFILAFVLMLIAFGAMAVGYIAQRKTIAGSCGGLGSVGVEKACDCDKPCADKQAKLNAQARQSKIDAWQKNKIH